MAVYNGEKYLKEAIESILSQTFSDFEFLIINDASIDNSKEIILKFQANDRRIVYLQNESNLGLTKSLNIGISHAKGKYIARMDADDISLYNRLELQYNYLENNINIGLCGSWYKKIGTNKTAIAKPVTKHADICLELLKYPVFGHPTVMFRKKVVIDNKLQYNEAYEAGQDYLLWVKFSEVSELANIPLILLLYRFHNQQITIKKQKIQEKNVIKVKEYQFKRFRIFDNKVKTDFIDFFSLHTSTNPNKIKRYSRLKTILVNQNNTLQIYNHEKFKFFLEHRLFQMIVMSDLINYHLLIKTYRYYHKYSLNIKTFLKIIIKFLLYPYLKINSSRKK